MNQILDIEIIKLNKYITIHIPAKIKYMIMYNNITVNVQINIITVMAERKIVLTIIIGTILGIWNTMVIGIIFTNNMMKIYMRKKL